MEISEKAHEMAKNLIQLTADKTRATIDLDAELEGVAHRIVEAYSRRPPYQQSEPFVITSSPHNMRGEDAEKILGQNIASAISGRAYYSVALMPTGEILTSTTFRDWNLAGQTTNVATGGVGDLPNGSTDGYKIMREKKGNYETYDAAEEARQYNAWNRVIENPTSGFDCVSEPVAVLTLDKGPDILLTKDMYLPAWIRKGETVEVRETVNGKYIEPHKKGRDMLAADERNMALGVPTGLLALLPGYDERGSRKR